MKNKAFQDIYKFLYYENPEQLESKRSRLFPIYNKIVDENSSSSIFLASLIAINEFQKKFLDILGIKFKSNANLHAYSQLSYTSPKNKKTIIPDGFLCLTTGKKNPIIEWTALLEFKTKDDLKEEQLLEYVDMAKELKVNAIITISNDFVSSHNTSPLNIKSTSSLEIFHFSWKSIQTILSQIVFDGIEDVDQVYLAEQLLLYFQKHPHIYNFSSMSKDWDKHLQSLLDNKKHSPKKQFQPILEEVSSDWEKEERDIQLELINRYNKKVTFYKKINLENRKKQLIEQLDTDNILESIYDVPLSNKIKNSLFDKTKYLNRILFKNIINLNNNKQILETELFSIKKSDKFLPQLKYIINSFCTINPGKPDRIHLKGFKGKKELFDISIDELIKNDKKDVPCCGIDCDSKESITGYKISLEEILGKSLIHRKKIVEKVENNINIFFSQIMDPYTD